jgi:hypothetical protein
MSTNAQINANQTNAQSSTGPRTEEGKQSAALNSTTHGFTGQNVVLTPAEKPAYDTHVIAYIEQYQPKTHQETDLIQQYADQQWTLYQINAQQISLMSMISAATKQHLDNGGELDTLSTATNSLYQQLRTLSLYEQRRHRAAKDILSRFKELLTARQEQFKEAVELYKSLKAQNKPFSPEEFGFVCSLQDIERHITREATRIQPRK